MNRVVLVGRLTRDPELRYTQSGLPVTSFTVAVNRPFAQEGSQTADFIPIVVWRKAAENCANYLNKGSQVAVEGRMQTSSYDDKDGKRVYRTDVVADRVEFLSTKKSGSDDNNQNNNGDGFNPGSESYGEEIPF